MKSDEVMNMLLIGVIMGICLSVAFYNVVKPEIKIEELCRLCLVKSIPLEECKIPPRPYEKDVNTHDK